MLLVASYSVVYIDRMDGLSARWRDRVRRLANRLAPAGSRREFLRIHLTRWIRRLGLPMRPWFSPPLPDFHDAAAVADYLQRFGAEPADLGLADRVHHWLDFHPFVLGLFPLATTPVQRPMFFAWLVKHRRRFGIDAGDIVAFGRELQDDPTHGLEFLYRRSIDWQQTFPGALTRDRWPMLVEGLARRYGIADAADIAPLSLPAADEFWKPDASARGPLAVVDVSPAVLGRDTLADASGFRPERGKQGVNVLAHFRYPSGLRTAAMNLCDALGESGWTVSRRDVPNRAETDLPTRRNDLGMHPYPITLVALAPDRLGINAYEVAGLDPRRDVYRIGLWHWELESAPASWARHARWLDEIWAPTKFVVESLRKVMPIPVHEMLPGIPPPPIVPCDRDRFGIPRDRFVFLFAFDMSSTSDRKNPEGLLDAFRRAFPPERATTLVLKITRGHEEPAVLERLRAAAQPGRVVIIDELLPASDFFALMNGCDAYVSLHRSEGFGLTLAEAMALGKPTIATAYSGNLDFMNDANSVLVDWRPTTCPGSRSYPRGGVWAEPVLDDAIDKLRWVVDHPGEAADKARRGRITIQRSLSLAAAGERMSRRLKMISPRNAR